MKKRVVVTGMGAITAAGEGARAFWDAYLDGRSGIGLVSFNGVSPAESGKPAAARIRDFNPDKFVTQRKALKVMARDIQLAVAASSLAMDDAGLRKDSVPRERFGVIVGSGVLNHEPDELAASLQTAVGEDGRVDVRKFGGEGLSALFPLWLLKYLPNMSACHVSILFDLQGPNNTITTGPSAGLQAVGEAFRILQRGGADVMLAGGAESKVNPVGMSHYQVMGVLSETDPKDPARGYQPFDAASKGVVIGEGAAFLVLEELEHALARGARIYAEITGLGSSSQNGEKIAIRAALADARLEGSDIDMVQACGLGLEKDDLREAEAIEELLSADKTEGPRVTASKPVTGFAGYAAGALDLVASCYAVSEQRVPPVLNLSKPRRSWHFRFVTAKPEEARIDHALTNAFGFGGQSVSVVTKRYAENGR